MPKETTCLHPDIEKRLTDWLKKRDWPAVLLIGEPGVGKTTLAYRVFQDAACRVIEFNASHTRSGTSFRKTILPLLREGGILEMIKTGEKGGIGILLDEIDGLSNGEKGGLQELLTYLKSPAALSGRPLILISNTLDTRTLQQIAKLCLTFQVHPVKRDILKTWLGQEPPTTFSGDLRSLQRQVAGLEKEEGPAEEIPEGVMEVAWWTLWNDWDIGAEFDIENNEGNLASLIALENIPERVEASLGNNHEAWELYRSLFMSYKVSDEGDFWAFFYQCWNILPVSLKLKLKIINMRLGSEAPLRSGSKQLRIDDFRYTPVLTKQSAMFNAWKLLCDISETYKIPVRDAPVYAHKEIEKGTLRPDKLRRYESISLAHLQAKLNQ
jgi:DNA polymerase III delta prime subunit